MPPKREGDGAEVHEAGDVFGVDDADDVLGAAVGVVDGDAGVLLFDDAGAGSVRWSRSAGREKILPRGVMISRTVTWLSSMARWMISS